MLCPPTLHKFHGYPASFHGEILNDRSIAGKSPSLYLQQMFTSLSHKHLENTNKSVTGDVLVAFCKGGGHPLNLLPKPLEEVR
jgi:hypothetical protein